MKKKEGNFWDEAKKRILDSIVDMFWAGVGILIFVLIFSLLGEPSGGGDPSSYDYCQTVGSPGMQECQSIDSSEYR